MRVCMCVRDGFGSESLGSRQAWRPTQVVQNPNFPSFVSNDLIAVFGWARRGPGGLGPTRPLPEGVPTWVLRPVTGHQSQAVYKV